jgi:flagellar biosynthesis chaperone FliJ
MKTPYDTAVRLQKRAMEDVRLAISVQVSQIVQIERSRATIGETLCREAGIAAAHHGLNSHAYLERMRAQRAKLAADTETADAQLRQLRAKAVAAYGGFHAVETAAERYRDHMAGEISKAEQGHLDDLATASFVRGLRKRAL